MSDRAMSSADDDAAPELDAEPDGDDPAVPARRAPGARVASLRLFERLVGMEADRTPALPPDEAGAGAVDGGAEAEPAPALELELEVELEVAVGCCDDAADGAPVFLALPLDDDPPADAVAPPCRGCCCCCCCGARCCCCCCCCWRGWLAWN